jgi:hypothetical protein
MAVSQSVTIKKNQLAAKKYSHFKLTLFNFDILNERTPQN